MKEEIIGGLKNALDRNETIEKAMQTFINAGYSATEVREAASMVNPSATGMLYGQPSISSTSQSSVRQTAQASKPATLPKQQTTNTPATASMPVTNVASPTKQNKGRKTAIILAIVLIVLVLVLGATIFLSESILNMFSP